MPILEVLFWFFFALTVRYDIELFMYANFVDRNLLRVLKVQIKTFIKIITKGSNTETWKYKGKQLPP